MIGCIRESALDAARLVNIFVRDAGVRCGCGWTGFVRSAVGVVLEERFIGGVGKNMDWMGW